ncbi:uncharacterized protein PgNI_02165 [Pyricularia grisea]|uniref:Uncharacterized protein n=1 Tax=Pyricularia grisea TaxID=148305 RepID=A0A6P8BLI3_PYRGI|nr:uncharacterized protein PgNI_02165 [Pyricularia grisea]TLD17668.1 hypothetical protein PgNI_02165 [Pyricularia grisea]
MRIRGDLLRWRQKTFFQINAPHGEDATMEINSHGEWRGSYSDLGLGRVDSQPKHFEEDLFHCDGLVSWWELRSHKLRDLAKLDSELKGSVIH